MDAPFTLIDDDRSVATRARVADGRVVLSAAALHEALGWTLEPEGLCRAGTCIPLRGHAQRIHAGGVDLEAFAELTERPLALDAGAGAAALGTSAGERGRRLASLEAPDFTLPDLAGAAHSLSDQRGKKVLLAIWASW